MHHPLHPERQTIKNVDFQVRRGEVVGIAGLMGAGRTEFAMSLFGRAWGRDISGRVRIDDREVDLSERYGGDRRGPCLCHGRPQAVRA